MQGQSASAMLQDVLVQSMQMHLGHAHLAVAQAAGLEVWVPSLQQDVSRLHIGIADLLPVALRQHVQHLHHHECCIMLCHLIVVLQKMTPDMSCALFVHDSTLHIGLKRACMRCESCASWPTFMNCSRVPPSHISVTKYTFFASCRCCRREWLGCKAEIMHTVAREATRHQAAQQEQGTTIGRQPRTSNVPSSLTVSGWTCSRCVMSTCSKQPRVLEEVH